MEAIIVSAAYLIAAIIVAFAAVYILSSIQMMGWLHAIQTIIKKERTEHGEKEKQEGKPVQGENQ